MNYFHTCIPTALLALVSVGSAIADGSDTNGAPNEMTIPSFPGVLLQSCAIIWEPEGVVQFTTDCNQGRENVLESVNGTIALGYKVGEKVITAQRDVEHVKELPQPILELISWVQSCEAQTGCVVSNDAVEIFDLLNQVDIGEGSWRFQLASSKPPADYGPVTYFVRAGSALFAFRTLADLWLTSDGVSVFRFDVVPGIDWQVAQ